MRLVDHQVIDLHPPEAFPKEGCAEAFGRYVEEFIVAVDGVVERDVDLPVSHAGIDGQGRDAAFLQVLDLVFHQGDQGRDHNADALAHQRRNLETNALSAAGRQDGQHVPPRKRFPDDFRLHRTETLISPMSP